MGLALGDGGVVEEWRGQGPWRRGSYDNPSLFSLLMNWAQVSEVANMAEVGAEEAEEPELAMV